MGWGRRGDENKEGSDLPSGSAKFFEAGAIKFFCIHILFVALLPCDGGWGGEAKLIFQKWFYF